MITRHSKPSSNSSSSMVCVQQTLQNANSNEAILTSISSRCLFKSFIFCCFSKNESIHKFLWVIQASFCIMICSMYICTYRYIYIYSIMLRAHGLLSKRCTNNCYTLHSNYSISWLSWITQTSNVNFKMLKMSGKHQCCTCLSILSLVTF